MRSIFILLLVVFNCSAQNFEISYIFKINYSFDTASEVKKFVLKQNAKYSIFELRNVKDITNLKHPELATILKERDTICFFNLAEQAIVGISKEKTYKDFESNFQISTHNINMTHQYVKDKIDVFDWEILNVKDTLIEKFKCKTAKTKFRGRDYIAFYTSEIANQGGPWKFDGLPGFILTVKSIDGFITIQPTSIRFINEQIKIENPFIKKKTIEFEEVAKKTLINYKERFARAKSSSNPPTSLTFGKGEDIEDTGLGEITLD